jgi:membrane-associated phospholipid phosphatase
LPTIESVLLFGYSLQSWPRSVVSQDNQIFLNLLDLLAAFAYLIHFAFAWIFALGLYLYNRRRRTPSGYPVAEPWTFLFTFGILNAIAVITQISWPTAPPWYVEQYGVDLEANYDMKGDEAGLQRVDQLIQFELFKRLYGQSPIVFGSFPSLHAAWPICITLFAPNYPILKFVGFLYTALVWWAAMYLNHHYLVDLIGGAVFTFFSYFAGTQAVELMMKCLKHRILSRGSMRCCAEKDLEDISIDSSSSLDEDDEKGDRTGRMYSEGEAAILKGN